MAPSTTLTLKGALVVPPQDPAAGAADIRSHAGNPEFVCVYLPAPGLEPSTAPSHTTRVDHAAEETSLPVAIHCGGGHVPRVPVRARTSSAPRFGGSCSSRTRSR